MDYKYSVLMSVYSKERPEYLETAIMSVMNQTCKPDQIVIVEDGELTDELYNVLDKYSSVNPNIDRLKLETNSGLGIALDKGLEVCRNDLVARMDSDDISVENRCERQLKLFRDNPNLSIVSGCIAEFIGDPKTIVSFRKVPERHEAIKRRMRTRSAFNHPAVMYKKSEVILAGGYGELKRKQDHDLFSRMMNNGCRAYNIQDVILYFRADENNLKRRKSWVNCKSYMIAQWKIYLRHECSLLDLIYVDLAQLFFYCAPSFMVQWVSRSFLRKEKDDN